MPSAAPLGRWGDRDRDHPGLDKRARDFIESQLGPPTPAPQPRTRELPAPRLSSTDLQRLFPGIEHGHTSDERARHSRGMSYLDLLTWRTPGPLAGVPDAVVYPRGHDEAVHAVQRCAREGIVVVPMGGGTSVTGALTPESEGRAVVVVSTERMNRILDVDHESGIATVESGITGPALEEHLGNWTLGHFPQSWQRASIGGYVAARSSGQSSGGYGRIEDMLLGATVATPVGGWRVGGYPAASMGPDLRHLVLGSEGTLGVITTAQLRLRAAPTCAAFGAAIVPGGLADGAAVMRELTRSVLRPTILRVSDPAETRAMLTMSGPSGPVDSLFRAYLRARGAAEGCLVILGWEGTRRQSVQAAQDFAWEVLAEAGAVRLGSGPGRSWAKGRFQGPYLRDDLMDLGYLVETFETVTTWSRLPELHGSITSVACELLGEHSYVMAHLSHSYDAGASVYFTVLAGGQDDPVVAAASWRHAKGAITEAIASQGGALSHHHGIGRDHAAWLPETLGPVGMSVIHAVKAAVDPQNIMNPGALTGGSR